MKKKIKKLKVITSISALVMLIITYSCKKNTVKNHFEGFTPVQLEKRIDSLLIQNDTLQVIKDFNALMQSKNEENLISVYQNYYRLGSDYESKTDSLKKVIVQKFPNGFWALNQSSLPFYDIDKTDTEQQEVFYDKWIKEFPPEKTLTKYKWIYNKVLTSIADNYAEQGNIEKSEIFYNQLLNEPYVAMNYLLAGKQFAKKNQPKKAEAFFKKSIEEALKYINSNDLEEDKLRFINEQYSGALSSYAQFLATQERNKEAKSYFEKYLETTDFIDSKINFDYAECLLSLGEKEKAYQLLEKSILADEYTKDQMVLFRKLYLETKGNESQLADFEKELITKREEKVRQDIIEHLIDESCPDFSLMTMDGTSVSNKSLLGNIVVLDFWATWCGPCIRSFPAMNEAKEFFKTDAQIKFFFVNTQEINTGDTRDKAIEEVMKNNNFGFKVLKDDNSKTSNAFAIKAIPQKIFIGKDGRIKYRLIGFEPREGLEEFMVKTIVEQIRGQS